jgi:hypothetical protein
MHGLINCSGRTEHACEANSEQQTAARMSAELMCLM